MKINFFLFCCAIVMLFSFVACKKKPSAGLGGNASLLLIAKHHNTTIDSITFFIKFNSTDAPSFNEFDIEQKAVTVSPSNSSALIENLKPGDYYIYAQGYDPTIAENVNGGLPYTIREEKLQTVIVAVTEQH